MKTKAVIAATLLGTSEMLFATTHLSEHKNESFPLAGVVNSKSQPFACSFGDFTVKVKGQASDGTETQIDGKGILINSAWLHKSVGMNNDITYVFPKETAIKDGSKFAVVCNEVSPPGRAVVTYSVPVIADGSERLRR